MKRHHWLSVGTLVAGLCIGHMVAEARYDVHNKTTPEIGVEDVRGQVNESPGTYHATLRPVAVQVGNGLARRLNDPVPGAMVTHIYVTTNGVPVHLTFTPEPK